MANLPSMPQPVPDPLEQIVSSLVIDWTPLEQFPLQEINCRCGTTFYSHAKYSGIVSRMVSKDKCPNCGTRTKFRAVKSSPERF